MTRTMKWTAAALVAALALAVMLMAGATAQATSSEPPAVAAAAPDDATCATVPEGTDQVPGCKTCKGREWCTCSYNGSPRISCNPCCYNTPSGTICRD